MPPKKNIYTLILSCLFATLIVFASPRFPLIKTMHWKIYDALLRAETQNTPPPRAIKDILLVTIDNDTVNLMAHCWPYPRTDFAQVIENLNRAHPRIIALDFAFFGAAPNNIDDAMLVLTLNRSGIVILANNISEDGTLNFPTLPKLGKNIVSGIVTKIEDEDGIIRRNMTYVVEEKKQQVGFLSWGMQILKEVKDINLATLTKEKRSLSFQNKEGEEWTIPINPTTNSFLIHFRAHTPDFKRISFYKILKGDFDPSLIKGKIVLIGFASSMLGDIHLSPIGWLPGLTVNANAFLTLYTHNFLKNMPKAINLIVLFIGVICSTLFVLRFSPKSALFAIGLEIFVFFFLSFLLLIQGYLWNYSLFPISVAFCPWLSKQIIFLKKT